MNGYPWVGQISREESLEKLALRYVNSHGPATLQDFAWWSGLISKDAAAGLESANPSLAQIEFKDQIYWSPVGCEQTVRENHSFHLLPAFDEYLLGYKDRSAVLAPPICPAAE